VVALVFGLGTMMAKAHYTADLLGALLLSHAVASLALHAFARGETAPVASPAPEPGAIPGPEPGAIPG
ncbi:MAG TPA: hypothetical protein VNM39_01710, partial [Verrucomicrobiae bacterium]|nr:hypothetical protein [Verrucomicrobiae bacterium]